MFRTLKKVESFVVAPPPALIPLRKAGTQECLLPGFLDSSEVLRRNNVIMITVPRSVQPPSDNCREAAFHAERSLGGVVGYLPVDFFESVQEVAR